MRVRRDRVAARWNAQAVRMDAMSAHANELVEEVGTKLANEILHLVMVIKHHCAGHTTHDELRAAAEHAVDRLIAFKREIQGRPSAGIDR